MGLAGIINATVYETDPISQVSGMANYPNFQHWKYIISRYRNGASSRWKPDTQTYGFLLCEQRIISQGIIDIIGRKCHDCCTKLTHSIYTGGTCVLCNYTDQLPSLFYRWINCIWWQKLAITRATPYIICRVENDKHKNNTIAIKYITRSYSTTWMHECMMWRVEAARW